MSMADIRAAFDASGGGKLRLDTASLGYQDNKQILRLTGWYQDDTPFSFTSEPFGTDPVAKAGEVATELATSHLVTLLRNPEPSPMALPNSIAGLGGTLREQIARAKARAEQVTAGIKSSVDNLQARLDEAETLRKDIDTAATEIQTALGTPNGGPPLTEN